MVADAGDFVASRVQFFALLSPFSEFSTRPPRMSWEAVTWANRQKLKKSYEQIVLLVLANCADPNGEAFVKWPGREHWWVYLSERTRLPKSSLFRHLNTLVALGLGERTMQVLADGSRRPTFKLNMEAAFDIDSPEDEQRYNVATSKTSPESQSPVGTEHDGDFEHDENDSDISHSQGEGEATIVPQSPVETGNPPSQSPVGTEPFPVLRLQEDSKSVPKDSPLPPSGGLPAVDQDWEEFVRSWLEPIPKMALAKSEWNRTETAKRAEIVAAAKGYWAWLKGHHKPPSAQSAQSFIRDAAGWQQWLRYTPDAGGKAPPITSGYPVTSTEAKALAVVYAIAGKSDFFHSVKSRGGQVYHVNPITPRLLALAGAPPRSEWVMLDHQQAAAWDGLISENLQIVRTRLDHRSSAPWPWPPRKDGTLSQAGPPDTLMTDQDFENFK